MPGYIHIYAKNSHETPRSDTWIHLFGNFSVCEDYQDLRKLGRNTHQGALGVLKVNPCEPNQPAFKKYLCGQWPQDIIEFTLSPHVHVNPVFLPGCDHPGKIDQLTFISFRQFIESKQQFLDVTLTTRSNIFKFAFDFQAEEQIINVPEWQAFYARYGYQAEITETYFEMSQTELEEQLFQEVPHKTRSKTTLMKAFKPAV